MGNIREEYKVEPKKTPKIEVPKKEEPKRRSDDSAFLAEEMSDLRDIEALEGR